MKVLCAGIVPGGDVGFLFRAMRRLELFAALDDTHLYKVLYYAKSLEFDAGETVFKKGDPGETFYIIQTGKASARVPGFLGLSKTVGTMGPGEFFGELALVLKRPRAATVVCEEKTVCFALARHDLERLMSENPPIAAAVKAVAERRSA